MLTVLSGVAAPATFAASIGVNFQGRDGAGAPVAPIDPAEVAGVVPQANWNNIADSLYTPAEQGTAPSLANDAGGYTAVTLTFDANDSWNSDGTAVSPDERLMLGIIKRQGLNTASTFTFSNLGAGPYDVFVYTSMNGDNVLLDTTLGSTTYYTFEEHQFGLAFIQALNTNPSGTRDVGNYVKFSNVIPTNGGFVVTATWRGGGDGNGIAGFQIVGASFPTNTRPVVITQPPPSRRVLVNQTVTFSVVTDVPARFQWFKGTAPLAGETNSTYTTPPVTAADNGTAYHVVASNNVNSVQSSDAVITIGQLVTVPGAKEQLWYGAVRADVEAGTQDSIPPDRLLALSKFEVPDEQGDNFAERVSALFRPPVTGDYVFFVASDDDSDLFISTDATPANKQLIAQEVNWCGDRNWTGNDGGTGNHELEQKRSDKWVPDPLNPPATPPFANGIRLTNGFSYYIEGVHHEGGGGDNFAATFKLLTDPAPASGDATKITGFLLAPYAQGLDGAYITVTNPPQSTTGIQNQTVTFTIGATSGYIGDTSSASPGLAYQWQSAPSGSSTFTNIPNASGSSFTTSLLKLSDSGAQFRVAMLAGDTNITSSAATLTVNPDTTPPRPVTVISVNAAGTVVTLAFAELMDKPSAETGANYVFTPGNVAGASASLAADGVTVTITPASALTPNVTNVLTITGVKDLAGNPVSANTTISFKYVPVTYEADILFDAPLGYYRFEDATNSPIAKNTGSTGGDGAYFTGDETAPMASDGTPSSAKGDAGPRPPTFAGFEANNHSATFDGVGEWVDTKNQYLQNRGAFTLEYWVNPTGGRTNVPSLWVNRVGIVGQNDAIEYGFIDPLTIQIWTPNGGSLNTAYNFGDDEWHHVATIASGANLKTYYDGALVGTGGNATGNYGAAGFNVHIGGGGVFDGAGNWFTGHLDEVAIFDKAIPAARIAEHYNAGKNGGVITTSGAVTPALNITLTIARSGNNVVVSWTPSGGTLQATSSLSGTPINWSDTATPNGGTITIGTGNSFYRVTQ
ncbi:MAG: hypothetical protein AUI63_00290 [Gemmatimonadetes bacterium 13_1_40CM_2_60_3]|nr:MAG: hypothetical protein AUI63_00290 [Gemmatimonadetes bacterium 13_1_40CM_2_60_3]